MALEIVFIPGFIKIQTPKTLTWMRVEGIKLVFIEIICNPKHQTHMAQLSTAAVWLNGKQYLCLSFEMLGVLFFSALLHAFMKLFIPCVEKHLSFCYRIRGSGNPVLKEGKARS